MPNQYSKNNFFQTLTQIHKPSDVNERTYKRKIYKRLKRLKTNLENASEHELLYVFEDKNYTDHKNKKITVMKIKYKSIMNACEAHYNCDSGITLEEWYNNISTRIRKLKHTDKEVTPSDIDKCFTSPLKISKRSDHSFTAIANSYGRNISSSLKQFVLLRQRVDIQANEYFKLSREQIQKLMLTPATQSN